MLHVTSVYVAALHVVPSDVAVLHVILYLLMLLHVCQPIWQVYLNACYVAGVALCLLSAVLQCCVYIMTSCVVAMLQQIQVCPEEESLLTTSFVNSLAHLQGKEAKENVEYDFQALRLDWFRLQALTSVNKAALRYVSRKGGRKVGRREGGKR